MEISERKIWKNTFYALIISVVLEVVILIIAAKFFCEIFKPFFFITTSIVALIIVFVSFGLLKGANATITAKFFNATGPFAAIVIIFFVSLKFIDNINCIDKDDDIDITIIFENEQGTKLQLSKEDYTYFLLPGIASTMQAEINSKGYAFFNGISKKHENTMIHIKICDSMLKHYSQTDTSIELVDNMIYKINLDEIKKYKKDLYAKRKAFELIASLTEDSNKQDVFNSGDIYLRIIINESIKNIAEMKIDWDDGLTNSFNYYEIAGKVKDNSFLIKKVYYQTGEKNIKVTLKMKDNRSFTEINKIIIQKIN